MPSIPTLTSKKYPHRTFSSRVGLEDIHTLTFQNFVIVPHSPYLYLLVVVAIQNFTFGLDIERFVCAKDG